MANTNEQSGVGATLHRGGLPNMVVEVLPDQTVAHPTGKGDEVQTFTAGDTFECEGPLAQWLAMNGHVLVKGLAGQVKR